MNRTTIKEINDTTNIKITIPNISPNTGGQLLITKNKLRQNKITDNGKVRLTIIPYPTLFRRSGRHQKRVVLKEALRCGHHSTGEGQQVISSACSNDQASVSMSYPWQRCL